MPYFLKWAQLTNLKYQAVAVNSTKENCGNPQKSFLLCDCK